MKILCHSPSLDPIGGVELCTVQDATALVQRGHEVTLLYGSDGALRSRYEHAGISLRGPLTFGFELRSAPRDSWRLLASARLARALRPDVLWLNRFEHIVWARSVAAWSRVPIVTHLHHGPNFRMTRLLSKGMDSFVAVSEHVKREWVAAGIASERIVVINNALPPSEYPPGGLAARERSRRELRLPSQASIILYYGRVCNEKGVDTLLRAWSRIRAADERLLLLIVGPPGDESDGAPLLESAIDGDHRILRLPLQTNVVSVLHAADLVVFPSKQDEAFGRVVIESFSSGRPVVASRVGAVPEILSGAMSRFLFEPENDEQLGQLLVTGASWREREPELEEILPLWVARRFPYERHVTELGNVLQSAVR